ncbi:hypothetical protein HXX76_003586 [Chlamydomonas incerta]|uniref:Uncharacterized protein n=1 Tax=Chlamydomonas incerta TaxID=51695 RepID=A0A835W815_CHLIN|nr:hypothetical protein HXX76_003586 [Chlamydomonas incerta]|eukprot:KAG2440729.1 hypothetical protein HXX76_003586 [Chlamydomonas incerta]
MFTRLKRRCARGGPVPCTVAVWDHAGQRQTSSNLQAACELVRSGAVKLATRQLRTAAPSTDILDFAMAPTTAGVPPPRGWRWLSSEQLYAYDVSCMCNALLWKLLDVHVSEVLMPSQDSRLS